MKPHTVITKFVLSPLWWVLGACVLMLGFVFVPTGIRAQEPPAQPTRITDAMIEHPVHPDVAFYVVTPYGREWAVPGPTISIDFEADPPVVSAVCEVPPPPVALTEVEQLEVLTAPKAVYALAHVPAPSRLVKVLRNGVRLAVGIDYAYAPNFVTVFAEQGTAAGDKILITYFRE